jgi:hypothetical protein
LKNNQNYFEESSEDTENKKQNITDIDQGTDLSDVEQYGKTVDNTNNISMSAFNEYGENSIDTKNIGNSERVADPEAQAKEEYMRKLMSFRKDELILPEDSDEENPEGSNAKKDKSVAGVETAYDLVEKVEDKMNKIAMVIKGMDKRMSYNLRLIGSVI